MDDFEHKVINLDHSRNIRESEKQAFSISSHKLSQDTTNSSHIKQRSYGGEYNSERSYIEKDSAYSVMKEQLERERNNLKVSNDQNEALLLQKAELLHKITQLQDKCKCREDENKKLLSENQGLKETNEELINSQYANASDKLNMLASELENKDEEMKTAVEEKSLEIQQIKTILDAKQSQISKMNVNLEAKDAKIKSLENNVKLLEVEVKNKSKEISTFEFSTKNEIESSLQEKENQLKDLKQKMAIKVVRLTKQEQKVSELSKELELEKQESLKMQKTMQNTIDELKKLNEETSQMYKSKLFLAENELETSKQDIESQKNRIYSAVNEVKSDLSSKISERDVVIEKLKNQLSINQTKGNKGHSQERHWVIESNLRDIISEHKQKLITEQTKRSQLEKDVEMFSEMLVKTKVP